MNISLKPFQDERPWGYFRQFCANTPVTVKIISVKPGEMLSLQSHNKREEFWRVISGSGTALVGDKQLEIKVADELIIPVNAKHRLVADEHGLEILEIAVGDFDENDIIRYDDKYNRQ